MKSIGYALLITAVVGLSGCATAEKATTEGGKLIGQTTNVVGGVSKGGAEAVKGQEENPYGR
ncbi:MAG: hypothetical protein A3C36_04015 [Omnitrophica WOR_2 bacterium RIFCSPHIGHO2_02_FULL_52_10]|nr:MAG: hypothetical protein A3C36_04015 [Omnitrophica WOR_2 bacterium RIFCSPHIGHO2_02_FULL_52_10]